MRLLYYPDPVLKTRCSPVSEFDERLRSVTARMIEIMHAAKGVGLAAPQVGLALRFFVCNPTGEQGDDLVCINPSFTELTGGAEAEEGCLSLPGVTVRMRRATKAIMQFQSVDGTAVERTGEELEARVWQHEADHLDGRLIIDKMSTADEIANRRAIKQLRDQFRSTRRP